MATCLGIARTILSNWSPWRTLLSVKSVTQLVWSEPMLTGTPTTLPWMRAPGLLSGKAVAVAAVPAAFAGNSRRLLRIVMMEPWAPLPAGCSESSIIVRENDC